MSSPSNFNEKDVGFIGEDLILEGTVHSRNKLVIHGTIKGEISGDDEITIGKSGKVVGSISGGLVTVFGPDASRGHGFVKSKMGAVMCVLVRVGRRHVAT